jgi:hypothetical protein
MLIEVVVLPQPTPENVMPFKLVQFGIMNFNPGCAMTGFLEFVCYFMILCSPFRDPYHSSELINSELLLFLCIDNFL